MIGVPPLLVLERVPVRGRRLDLIVPAGDLVTVSGETSADLLWVIAGHRPLEDGGRVLVDGRPIESAADAIAAGVVFIPGGGALATLLTAYENILIAVAEREGDGESSAAERARSALAAVGLSESADHLVEELSGGQQQRVAVARAIACRPRLLLAEQPTTDLDAGNRSRILGLLQQLVADGSAVLLTSDDPAVIASGTRTLS